MSEEVISRQTKIQTKNHNNSPSSEMEWYKVFGCRTRARPVL